MAEAEAEIPDLVRAECGSFEMQVMKGYLFLAHMQNDPHFPKSLVLKGVDILRDLCSLIERDQPKDLAALYVLTHAATERFNDLAEEFWAAGSEIETVARESICEDMCVIAKSYGFTDADPEELVAPRDW